MDLPPHSYYPPSPRGTSAVMVSSATRSRPTGEDVVALLQKSQAGMTPGELADELGTTAEVILGILSTLGTAVSCNLQTNRWFLE